MATSRNPTKVSKRIPKEFQDYVNARKRPAVFLFLADSMGISHVIQLRDALGNRNFNELDLVINSDGFGRLYQARD